MLDRDVRGCPPALHCLRVILMLAVRVVVIDEHRLFAEALVALLGASGELRAVGYALTIRDGIALIIEKQPDIVLSEIVFGERGSGLSLPRNLRDKGMAGTPVVFLSRLQGRATAVAVKDAGGSRLLSKSISMRTLQLAVMRAAGRPSTRAPNQRSGGQATPRTPPTRRRVEILESIGRGQSDEEIAGELGISARTVETHVRRLFERYEVHSRSQLIHIADQNGWLDRHRVEPSGGARSGKHKR